MTPGGKAARGGVKEMDFLLAINGDTTEGLLHFDAQQMVKATGMTLQLKLSRCVCVCVCVWGGGGGGGVTVYVYTVGICVYVCVHMCVCICVCTVAVWPTELHFAICKKFDGPLYFFHAAANSFRG